MARTVRSYKAWQESYEIFVTYQKENPRVSSPRLKFDGFNLGQWVSSQRISKKRGTLSPDRIKRLEEAGIIWDANQEAWEEGYTAFVAYIKENPDVLVAKKTKYHDYKLGQWVSVQRTAYNKRTLSPERIKRLEQAGIVWDLHQEAWEQGHKAFVAYKQEFPDVPIPHKVKYHDFNLGFWVNTQRRAYSNGTLSAERIKRLEEAGFVWEIRKSATELIAMFERGENVFYNNFKLPRCIRKHLFQKYNNTCAIGLLNLNNFTILPESKQKLDGKNCQFTTDPLFTRKSTRMDGAPNLEIAHLDDNFSNNTITNLLPLCPICHGEITYSAKQTLEHLKKANVTSSRRKTSKEVINAKQKQTYTAKRIPKTTTCTNKEQLALL